MSVGTRIDWAQILEIAATIVRSYSTSVTLRQLFYRLVACQALPNTSGAYKRLSKATAAARRRGTFPDLIDRGREIHRRAFWSSPAEIIRDASMGYRRDRTEGQDVSIYLGVEKAGLVIQLQSWFGDLGIPILALVGYPSQTYVQDIVNDVSSFGRPAVLLYAGDFDPSGEDIDRDLLNRTRCWSKVVRVALTAEQVQQHDLPVNAGKETDTRAAGFIRRHGELVQVELDALPPEALRELYQAALDDYWDQDAYEDVMEREAEDRKALTKVFASMKKVKP